MYKFIMIVFVLTGINVYAQTPRIEIKEKGLYPEGAAYDKTRKCFYVSSVTEGTIGVVDANGSYKPLYTDSTLQSSFGMKVDDKRNCLWVCAGMRRVLAISLPDGKKIQDIDLALVYAGKHFINDLTLDAQGNIYITDSYSPVIYKVDAGGKASVFTQSELFKGLGINLNGVAVSNKGFLLVDNDQAGALYRVDMKSPGQITKVAVPTFFPGADGLLLISPDTLVLVQNKSVDKVFELVSADNWKTARVIAATAGADRLQQPSAVTLANGTLYVLNSKINELSDPTKKPSPEFSLQEVRFRPMK